MKKIVLKEIAQENLLIAPMDFHRQREPVHVVYGGANLFTAETPQKLGKLALKSMETYAPNFVEFAYAMWLAGADTLPTFADVIKSLENQLKEHPEKVKEENYAAWFAWTVYQKTIKKLKREPIEDFRIDFEDGYGFRSDEEEDQHAISASDALAKSFIENTITPFCGFRIKSFAPETKKRAVRTLNLFLENLIKKTNGNLPENFAVTLPKITNHKEIKDLRKRLEKFEAKNNLSDGTIKIEIMIETPQAIVNKKGKTPLRKFIEAGKGRVNSAHFGAFDYTASLGISAVHQHLRHETCNFARQLMLVSLAPLDIRLSDSVTTEIPVAIHKGENLSEKQIRENKRHIHAAWRTHFNNVTHSQINGFYQSWDLHPAQIAARYAAVFAFFLESQDAQSQRLKGFIEKATQANMTGNTFDDAASANGLLNFFLRALNSGSISEKEISETTSLNADELRLASFLKIMKKRKNSLVKIAKLSLFRVTI
ncbi:aldolase/citrate lyase family protein [soil metagenome]